MAALAVACSCSPLSCSAQPRIVRSTEPDCVGCNMQTWPLRTIGNMSPPPAFPLTLTCRFNSPCHPGKAKNEVLGSLLLL
ncbi:hypothetical protein NQZ68_034201 [Dissostichus eleginoides]|nr:hypothetical protein NQZ68_034201 [Dissostichus eleginoides]